MKVPQITEEQETIIKWARSFKKHYINLNFIIELLVSQHPNEDYSKNEEYLNAREIYKKYNSSHKDNILMAIMMNCYSLDNDFKEGDIVTNGIHVGFATNIDLSNRDFYLTSTLNSNQVIGKFKMIDFAKV